MVRKRSRHQRLSCVKRVALGLRRPCLVVDSIHLDSSEVRSSHKSLAMRGVIPVCMKMHPEHAFVRIVNFEAVNVGRTTRLSVCELSVKKICPSKPSFDLCLNHILFIESYQ